MKDLTGQVRGADLKTADQQAAETARRRRGQPDVLRDHREAGHPAAEEARRHQAHPRFSKKAGRLVTNWARNAWNPTLLEITVVGHAPGADPEAWAMYVQQQRLADDYRDALKFPSPCTWRN